MLKTQNKIVSLFLIFVLTFGIFSFLSKTFAAASFPTNGGGTINTSQTFTLTISANRSSAYNAVTVNATFSNLTYLSSSVVGGWTPVSGPSRSGNTVSFSGAILGNSVSGTRSVLAITFRAPGTPGSASVSISGTVDGTGVGTGSESGTGFVSYTVKAAPTPTPTAKPAPGGVNLSSTTHPDQNKWYKSPNAIINWNKEAGVTDFSMSVDNNPNSTPDDTSEGGDTTRTLNGLGEGVSYFHIKAKNDVGWGPTTTFRISIDTSSPDPFTATSVKRGDGSYYLFFATSDSLSGIKQYNVVRDGTELGSQSTGLTLPAGTKNVSITAIDNTDNTRVSTLNIQEESITVTPSTSISTTATSTPSITSTEAPSDSKNTTNPALVIALILVVVYAIVISTLYLTDKGYLNRVVKKLNGTQYGKDSEVGKSPFK